MKPKFLIIKASDKKVVKFFEQLFNKFLRQFYKPYTFVQFCKNKKKKDAKILQFVCHFFLFFHFIALFIQLLVKLLSKTDSVSLNLSSTNLFYS